MKVSEIVLIILGIQVSNFFMFLFGLLLTKIKKEKNIVKMKN